VIDLMAALKRSLGQAVSSEASAKASQPRRASKSRKGASPEEARRQPGLKLPDYRRKGSRARAGEAEPPPPLTAPEKPAAHAVTKRPRKRA